MKKDIHTETSEKKVEDRAISRREALRKIVVTTAYVAPVATVMLAGKNAKAGVGEIMTSRAPTIGNSS